MRSRFQRFFREIKQSRKRKDKEAIDVSAEGLVFSRRKTADAVRWGDITTIAAGTHAMLSGELFFVTITAKGKTLEIDEFVDGFNAFERALVKRFPGIGEKFAELQKTSSLHERLAVVWTSGSAA